MTDPILLILSDAVRLMLRLFLVIRLHLNFSPKLLIATSETQVTMRQSLASH